MATDTFPVLPDSFRFQQLDIYIAARELAAVVHRARISDAELRDQASRASKSVFLNIAEGLPSDSPGIRRRHFSLAQGSLCETVAALDLARVLGAVAPGPAGEAQALAARVRRMLRALTCGGRAG
jgi:four helix bundle protein